MSAAGRQDATGGASALQLFNAITDPNATSITATGTVSGWVFARPFTICIDPNTPSEEKCLCSGLSGANPATIAVLTRGYDGTVPTTHGVGAVITHVYPAAATMDFERHVYDTNEDDHTQYLTTDRHASPTKHEFGTPHVSFAFGAGTTTPAAVGTVADPGVGANPARDDHAHILGTGSVNAFAQVDAALVGGNTDIVAVTDGATAAGGTATKFARADHVHAFTNILTLTYAQISALAGGELRTGRQVWQTDGGSGRLFAGIYQYDGVAWRLPWNLAWGYQADAIKSGGTDCGTGFTDVLTLAVPVLVNRRYRVTAFCNGTQITSGPSTARARVIDDQGGVKLCCYQSSLPLADSLIGTGVLLMTPTSTRTITFKVQGAASAGAYRVLDANADLLVEDIGPAGVPA